MSGELVAFDTVRAEWPVGKPLGVRFSASDWVEGGWDLEGSITYSKALEARGCDFLHVSSGGNSPDQKIDVGPGYQTHFAEAVKQAVEVPASTTSTDPSTGRPSGTSSHARFRTGPYSRSVTITR